MVITLTFRERFPKPNQYLPSPATFIHHLVSCSPRSAWQGAVTLGRCTGVLKRPLPNAAFGSNRLWWLQETFTNIFAFFEYGTIFGAYMELVCVQVSTFRCVREQVVILKQINANCNLMLEIALICLKFMHPSAKLTCHVNFKWKDVAWSSKAWCQRLSCKDQHQSINQRSRGASNYYRQVLCCISQANVMFLGLTIKKSQGLRHWIKSISKSDSGIGH